MLLWSWLTGLSCLHAILEGTRLGCYNGHASLLPRWRGAAPIQRAIMAGDDETGIMIMKMDEGLDTGPVAMAEKVKITADMTAGELHDQLSMAGADLMVRAMAALERDSLTLTPQSEDGVTYASKITKAETRIDWTQAAIDVHNRIRGLAPFPGAWCEMEIGEELERVKLLRSILATGVGDPGTVLGDDLRIACGEGAIRLRSLQRAGGKVMDGLEFQRGAKIAQGTRLP